MRCSSLRPSPVLLGLGLALACSSASPEAEPEVATKTETQAEPPASDEPQAPTVGTPAPALALDSLSGTRVRLPAVGGDRATVLIFGSFS
jgi:hypothetical protein